MDEAMRAQHNAAQRERGYQRAEREIAALRADLARAHFERDSAARDCVDAEAQCDVLRAERNEAHNECVDAQAVISDLRAELAERTRERDDLLSDPEVYGSRLLATEREARQRAERERDEAVRCIPHGHGFKTVGGGDVKR